MAITLTPAMMTAINLTVEIAVMQLSKKVRGMKAEELKAYIVGQEKRKANLIRKIDNA